jgi:hypothetical protein
MCLTVSGTEAIRGALAKMTKQLTVVALLSFVCLGDVSWALALRALSHGPHTVSLSLDGAAEIVLHHHGELSEDGPQIGATGGHHDDHVIRGATEPATGPRRFSVANGSSPQLVPIEAAGALQIEHRLSFELVVSRSLERSPPRRTVVLRI